jgi:hypothetical protein
MVAFHEKAFSADSGCSNIPNDKKNVRTTIDYDSYYNLAVHY